MKWLTNIYDPKLPDAKSMLIVSFGETRDEAWEAQQRWLQDKIIGNPKPSSSYSLQEMKNQGLVGVYAK